MAALFDDSIRNTRPAADIGVWTYEINNFGTRQQGLLAQLQQFRGNLTEDREFFTVDATYRRLRRPAEASQREKTDHENDKRSCFKCGARGHIARNCPGRSVASAYDSTGGKGNKGQSKARYLTDSNKQGAGW